MANPKMTYDEQEVNEIIQLKLQQLGGVKKKLTPNNVKNFNEEIAENPLYLRSNGQMFKKYSYTFWIDKNYYGNKKVREIQEADEEFNLAGEAFVPEVKDIILLVNKYMNNPQQLTQRLIKLFEGDKKELTYLRRQVAELHSSLDRAKNDLEQFKIGFVTVFMNSIESYNSLNDVLSLKKSEDNLILDELKTMFNGDFTTFKQEIRENAEFTQNKTLLRLSPSKGDKIKELEDEGF